MPKELNVQTDSKHPAQKGITLIDVMMLTVFCALLFVYLASNYLFEPEQSDMHSSSSESHNRKVIVLPLDEDTRIVIFQHQQED